MELYSRSPQHQKATMSHTTLRHSARTLAATARLLAASACLLAAGLATTAHAAKPEWAGNQGGGQDREEVKGQGKQKARAAKDQDDHSHHGDARAPAPAQAAGVEIRIGGFFGDSQREAATRYYSAQASSGKCPPGLAKKNNGCQPPGQAKKWNRGQPLAKDVQWYPVPREVQVRIGLPPAGYKYVRVAGDILLVAIGTMMVVDAIEDLMR